MKNKKEFFLFALFAVFFIGCGTPRVSYNETLKSNLQQNLNSCMGKLTTAELLMFASSPSEKNTVSDGEIWIYKYRKSKTTTKTTITGNGGLLNPYEAESTSESYEYTFDMRLRFNKQNILIDWSYTGQYAMFNHPFLTHKCY